MKVIGQCVQCGNCCRYASFFRYNVLRDGHMLPNYRKDIAYHCPLFQEETNTCKVHGSDKPPLCKKWPLFPFDPVLVGCKGFTIIGEYTLLVKKTDVEG